MFNHKPKLHGHALFVNYLCTNALDIYKSAFRYQNMGWAAAESFVLFLIVMGVTLFQMRVLRTDWEY